MKHTIFSLVLLVATLLSASAFAQSELDELRTSKKIVTWSESDLPAYSIQIYSTQNAPTDASFVKSAEVVYEYVSTDNLYKYFYGCYSTYAEANKDLSAVRGMGFDDAFVVNTKKYANSSSTATASTSSSSSSSSATKLETTGHKKIEIDENKEYVVQVGAYRYPLYISYFENVGKVYEYRFNDKIFRYTTTPVKGTQIESELKRVKALGYDAAFIVEYSTYSPYRIE